MQTHPAGQLQLIRPDVSNIGFIHDLLVAGAHQGHFSARLLEKTEFIHNTLSSLLNHGRLYGKPLRAAPVLFAHNNVLVGFAIMAEVEVNQGGNEVYAMAVAQAFRGRGYGRTILQEILQRWSSVTLYARCFPASQQMYHMLVNSGFVFLYVRPDGSRVLCRPIGTELSVSA